MEVKCFSSEFGFHKSLFPITVQRATPVFAQGAARILEGGTVKRLLFFVTMCTVLYLTFMFQYLVRTSRKPARCLPRLPPPPLISWGASGGDQYPSPCPARTLATWENLSSQGDFPQNIYYTFSLIAFFPFRGDFSASEPCDVFLDVECKARVSFGGGDGAKKSGSADQETVSKTRWDCRASQFLSRKKKME